MGLLDGQTQQAYYGGNAFGNYQFTSLNDIINQFIIAYIGEDKIIPKAKRLDVAFHAQRAMQELSFDTFKSCKGQEFTVPPTLQMPLPQDYVNYTKISWVDSAGIKHLLYPTNKTSNPLNPPQDSNGNFEITFPDVIVTTGNNTVVLDDVYSVPVGSFVTGPTIGTWQVAEVLPALLGTGNRLTLVSSILNYPSLTTVYLNPTVDITETLTLSVNNANFNLTAKNIRISPVTVFNIVIGDNLITLDNASDADGLEIGMVLNLIEYFPLGTKITGISGKYISLSNGAILNFSGNLANGLYFTSTEYLSDTWNSYKSNTPSENNSDDYEDDTYWPMAGNRYGLDPQHANVNGSYYIDCKAGKIHFSSNISGKTVILDYISDSLGTDEEMQVHKFAEEAMYKWIIYSMVSTRAGIPEYVVQRYKKEKFAETRKAKLRLSNIKLEEITQILRGKSKQIKH